MKYFLVMLLYQPCGGIDCGIVQGYRPQIDRQLQIEMPSLETCEQIKKLNKFRNNIECWSKLEDIK